MGLQVITTYNYRTPNVDYTGNCGDNDDDNVVSCSKIVTMKKRKVLRWCNKKEK